MTESARSSSWPAGLDARAFRLPLPPDTTVFEVDRSDIVDVKEALVEEAGLVPAVRP